MREYFAAQHWMGTIAVLTDLEEDGERIFELLKSRVDIEQLYDTFKNTIHADRSYMRDDYQLNGWLSVNFIAMRLTAPYDIPLAHEAAWHIISCRLTSGSLSACRVLLACSRRPCPVRLALAAEFDCAP